MPLRSGLKARLTTGKKCTVLQIVSCQCEVLLSLAPEGFRISCYKYTEILGKVVLKQSVITIAKDEKASLSLNQIQHLNVSTNSAISLHLVNLMYSSEIGRQQGVHIHC